MTRASLNHAAQRALIVLAATVVAAIVIGALFWAKAVFIPLAMAAFLAFLLNPMVRWLQRQQVPRVPAVVAVVLGSTMLLSAMGWMVTRQLSNVVVDLPSYTSNIQKRVESLRHMSEAFGPLQKMLDEVVGEDKATPPPDMKTPSKSEPTPVVVHREGPFWLNFLPTYLGTLVEAGAELGLALVLVLFILLKRDDIHSRFLRLVGEGRIASTARAVDEAGQRLSRYLRAQFVINFTLGALFAIGLAIIGVQYALLWGFLLAVMRYVPYIGTWMAAMFPITLSLAMFDDWAHPLAVVGYFFILELLSYNVFEPLLFSRSMGVSEVALLLSAAFWAFLWGPIGLVLSAPLTVCLVVIGKNVPYLSFLDILLGNEPPLHPATNFYHRLVARDQDDALEIALAESKEQPSLRVFDDLFIPAMNQAKHEREDNELSDADEVYIVRAARDIADAFDERVVTNTNEEPTDELDGDGRKHLILGCGCRDEFDRFALELLERVIDAKHWHMDIVSSELLTGDVLTRAVEMQPDVVCIAAVPPGGMARARYLCKRLRAQLPKVKIMVGRWGKNADGVTGDDLASWREAGADEFGTSLADTCKQLQSWAPILGRSESSPLAGAAH